MKQITKLENGTTYYLTAFSITEQLISVSWKTKEEMEKGNLSTCIFLDSNYAGAVKKIISINEPDTKICLTGLKKW